MNSCRKSWKIKDFKISNDRSFMYLSLEVPEGYSWKPGQYVNVNIPSVSPLQWHPFTIASAPNDKHLDLIIKRRGDWTARVIYTFAELKKKGLCEKIGHFTD